MVWPDAGKKNSTAAGKPACLRFPVLSILKVWACQGETQAAPQLFTPCGLLHTEMWPLPVLTEELRAVAGGKTASRCHPEKPGSDGNRIETLRLPGCLFRCLQPEGSGLQAESSLEPWTAPGPFLPACCVQPCGTWSQVSPKLSLSGREEQAVLPAPVCPWDVPGSSSGQALMGWICNHSFSG